MIGMGRERRVVFTIFGIMALISILFISIPEAQASHGTGTITLIDENAKVEILPHDTFDNFSWEVDGTEHDFIQLFFTRTDPATKEVPLDFTTLGTPVLDDTDGDGDDDTVILTFTGSAEIIEITWTLKGGPLGSDASTLLEKIVVECIGSFCGKMHFFQYSDFDLGGGKADAADDTVEIFGSNTAFQFDDFGSTGLSETVVSPTPTHHEVAIFPTILVKLTDVAATTLSDLSGPLPGDAEWAFQWDAFLGAFGSDPLEIEKCKRIGPLNSGITGNFGCEPLISGQKDGAPGHEPPTIGKNMAGTTQIVENGICIDAQCWTVTENFHVDFELVELFTGEHTISNTIFCNKGAQDCNHVTLAAGPYHQDSKGLDGAIWTVTLDKSFQGELTVVKDDPDGYLGDVTCTAQIIEEKYWGTSCTIDFLLPIPGGFMLGTQFWDDYGGVRNWFFNDGIAIIDTFGYPSVDTEFDPSLDLPRVCLVDNPDKRTSCAFAKKVQLEKERAEKIY